MRSEKLNQDALHELEVVDAVVRGGGHARPEDAALTDFALLVRNSRPVPDHGAAMRLDERLVKRHPARAASRKPLVAALATFALVLVVGGAALNADREGSDGVVANSADLKAPASGSGELAQDSVGSASTRAAAQELDSIMKQPFRATSQVNRDVARDAELTLATPGEKLDNLSDRVVETVDVAGGYVASSELRTAQGERGRAEFALMLTAETFQETFKDLSRLAHVRSRSQSTEDITAEFNSARRSVRLRQERVDALEAKLARATTAEQRASIERQLGRAKFALRQSQARLRSNRARVSYVPVELKIVADNSAASSDQGTIGKAIDRAGEILTGIAAAMIVFLAVGLPIALVVVLAYGGYRRWHRSRANRAIGEAAARP